MSALITSPLFISVLFLALIFVTRWRTKIVEQKIDAKLDATAAINVRIADEPYYTVHDIPYDRELRSSSSYDDAMHFREAARKLAYDHADGTDDTKSKKNYQRSCNMGFRFYNYDVEVRTEALDLYEFNLAQQREPEYVAAVEILREALRDSLPKFRELNNQADAHRRNYFQFMRAKDNAA